MKVAIHQPEHLPWLGFFHKMLAVDLMIILDTVQYRRRYFQNRNRIRSEAGWQWVTVPVRQTSRNATRICDVMLADSATNAIRKNLRTMHQLYSRARYFDEYFETMAEAYNAECGTLCALNCQLIRKLCDGMGIDCAMILASSLSPDGHKGELILDLCRKAGAECYFAGISGRDYLDVSSFQASGIRVEFQEFYHPVYAQVYPPFEPCMSGIDLLFNEGPRSRSVLAGEGVPVLAEVFT